MKTSPEGFKGLTGRTTKKDPLFTFRICYDDNCIPTGIIWMTGIMRRAYEFFGEILCVDAMKRKLNSLEWPYLVPVILDGDKRIFVACERFVCSEMNDAYEFMFNSLFDMAPGRSR